MSTKGKVAIVTGASRGIGRAIATLLASNGFAVVVNYVSKPAEAQGVVQEIASTGGRASAIQADVSKPAEVTRLFDETARLFGGVDVLVNNAGVLDLKSIAETSEELFERTISINLTGTFNAMKAAGKALRSGGRIINLSTTIVALALPNYGAYAASKAGVELLTKVMAKELRGRNITVNAVAPGPTATDLFIQGKTPEQIETFRKMAPLERLGEPEDIARVVAFLASENSGWVNGQIIRANGGIA